MKKMIFFDLDNTLINHSHAEKTAMSETFYSDLESFLNCEFNEFYQVYLPINAELWNQYNQSKLTRDEVKIGRFVKTLQHFDIQEFDVHSLWKKYAERYRKNWIPIENAEIVLDDLRTKNYSLGIISNGFTDIQTDKIKTMKWEKYFDAVIFSEMAGIQKPNRAVFDYALKISGQKAENVIYVGDSFETDIEGANNAGWESIYFNQNGKSELNETYRTITDLRELKAIF